MPRYHFSRPLLKLKHSILLVMYNWLGTIKQQIQSVSVLKVDAALTGVLWLAFTNFGL